MLNILRQPDDILISTDSHPLSRNIGDVLVQLVPNVKHSNVYVVGDMNF